MGRHRTPVLLALLISVRAAAAGQPVLIDKVVAVVNDEVITLSELQKEEKPLIQRIREELTGDARASQMEITERQILDALILRRLQLQEAKKEKVTVNRAEVTATLEKIKRQNGLSSDVEFAAALAQENLTLREFRTKVWEQLVVDRLLIKKVRTSVLVSEEEVTRYYEAHTDEFQQAPSVRIRHILVRLPRQASPADRAQARTRAAEALEQLKDGADFAQVAAQYSDGAAAQEGGDLGVIRKGELDPALESVAFSLKPGSISEVVETGAGLNIIKVEERTIGDVPIARVREQMRQRLLAEKLRQRMKAYFAEIKAKAYIDVRLGK
ncbi:MAG: peptidylprolyl isomerase [Candidatus Methylomirabilales bacterium]